MKESFSAKKLPLHMRVPPGLEPMPGDEIILTMIEIAKYMECAVATVESYARRPMDPLPIKYFMPRQCVFAYKSALREWCRRQVHSYQNQLLQQQYEHLHAEQRERVRTLDKKQREKDRQTLAKHKLDEEFKKIEKKNEREGVRKRVR